MAKPNRTFTCEVVDSNAQTHQFSISLNSSKAGSVQIGTRKFTSSDFEKSDEQGHVGLGTHVDVLVDRLSVGLRVFRDQPDQITIVAVSGGYGRQESYSVVLEDGRRLVKWIAGLDIRAKPSDGQPAENP